MEHTGVAPNPDWGGRAWDWSGRQRILLKVSGVFAEFLRIGSSEPGEGRSHARMRAFLAEQVA